MIGYGRNRLGYDDQGRVSAVGIHRVTRDAAGVVTRVGAHSHTYDEEGRLIKLGHMGGGTALHYNEAGPLLQVGDGFGQEDVWGGRQPEQST